MTKNNFKYSKKSGYTQNASPSKIFLQTIQKNRRHGEWSKQVRMDPE